MTEPLSLAALLARSTEPLYRAGPPTHTDGRTDGRTENELTTSDQLAKVDAGVAQSSMTDGVGYDPSNRFGYAGRHPVTRLGERDPIPSWIRSAVWLRDDGRCDLCADGQRTTPWELDHMLPWSAGGSDQSTNLRVLCVRHNQERSNWVDASIRYRRPVTWWCLNCYSLSDDWSDGCPFHQGRDLCPVKRANEYALVNGEPTDWFQRPAIVEARTVAFCAHCNAPGLTDRPL